MAADKTRVDFNAPTSLVERVDAVAEILDTSRTRILIDALRDELEELAQAEEVRGRISDGFYDERIEFETVEAILGTETAIRMKLIRDSVDREPPEPTLAEAPSASEFYDGTVQEWTPTEDAEEAMESLE